MPIQPHLWFDPEDREAAESYVSTIPDSRLIEVATVPDMPSGDVEVLLLEQARVPFQRFSADSRSLLNGLLVDVHSREKASAKSESIGAPRRPASEAFPRPRCASRKSGRPPRSASGRLRGGGFDRPRTRRRQAGSPTGDKKEERPPPAFGSSGGNEPRTPLLPIFFLNER